MRHRTFAIILLAAAAPCAATTAAHADEARKHEMSAPSSVVVDVQPDGTVAMAARNVRYVPYTILNPRGDHPTVLPRLATVTTDLRSRSDAEGIDPASTVSVTIDDLSSTPPQRLAAFSDRGSDGSIVDERYFVATRYGCCGGVDRHVVHATESGRLLFHSTGEGAMGRVGWADMPNARPAITRWAAFDGDVGEDDLKKGVLGTLAYGGDDGPHATLQLRMKGAEDAIEEKNLELASGVDIVWRDGKRAGAKTEDQTGDSGSPASMWIAENAKSPQDVGGFTLLLRLGKTTIAAIPITADRLDLAKAQVATGFTLAPAPAP